MQMQVCWTTGNQTHLLSLRRIRSTTHAYPEEQEGQGFNGLAAAIRNSSSFDLFRIGGIWGFSWLWWRFRLWTIGGRQSWLVRGVTPVARCCPSPAQRARARLLLLVNL